MRLGTPIPTPAKAEGRANAHLPVLTLTVSAPRRQRGSHVARRALNRARGVQEGGQGLIPVPTGVTPCLYLMHSLLVRMTGQMNRCERAKAPGGNTWLPRLREKRV
jgi:hypothetical protein